MPLLNGEILAEYRSVLSRKKIRLPARNGGSRHKEAGRGQSERLRGKGGLSRGRRPLRPLLFCRDDGGEAVRKHIFGYREHTAFPRGALCGNSSPLRGDTAKQQTKLTSEAYPPLCRYPIRNRFSNDLTYILPP